MNLESLAYLAQILGAVTVVIALVFGVVQIRQFRQQRRDAAAVELMRAIQDAEFTRSLRLVASLPAGASAGELRARGELYEDAALAIGAKYETLGYLVFRGTIPLELVEELVGGVAVLVWSKLRGWVGAVREEQEQPLFLEWFQWLAERLEARGRAQQVPAYLRFRSWRPATSLAPAERIARTR